MWHADNLRKAGTTSHRSLYYYAKNNIFKKLKDERNVSLQDILNLEDKIIDDFIHPHQARSMAAKPPKKKLRRQDNIEDSSSSNEDDEIEEHDQIEKVRAVQAIIQVFNDLHQYRYRNRFYFLEDVKHRINQRARAFEDFVLARVSMIREASGYKNSSDFKLRILREVNAEFSSTMQFIRDRVEEVGTSLIHANHYSARVNFDDFKMFISGINQELLARLGSAIRFLNT